MGRFFLTAAIILLWSGPRRAWGCACGCGVFDVQAGATPPLDVETAAMLPTRPGGTASLEYNFMDQNRDWRASSPGSAADNADKRLRTQLVTVGVRSMFNRRWGFSVEAPVFNRYFRAAADDGGTVARNHTALGDIRVRAIYSGFSPDMSSGVTFGAKLPTGDYKDPGFDRDTEIGSGSADVLLGGYHRGSLISGVPWKWYANLLLDQPVLTAGGYRPGVEVDALAGAYFSGWALQEARIVPLAQLVAVFRAPDAGTLAHPADSGYRRLMLGPGLELAVRDLRLNGSVSFPVAQYANGNQLVAPEFFKLSVAAAF